MSGIFAFFPFLGGFSGTLEDFPTLHFPVPL